MGLKSYFEEKNTIDEFFYEYYTEQKEFESLNKVPFSKLREIQILKNFKKYFSSSGPILEIGCGIGHLVVSLLDNHLDAYAIDSSQEAVKESKKLLSSHNHDSNRISHSDLFDYSSEFKFKSIVSNGVICYYEDQLKFLQKISSLMTDQGVTFISHRNALFNLFALNEGTLNFIAENFLCHFDNKGANIIESLKEQIPGMDHPIDIFSNSKVFRSAENPLTISELYLQAGFSVKKIIYSIIHPFPPRIKTKVSFELIKSVHEKYEEHWAGMFMGSQFIVIAEKA